MLSELWTSIKNKAKALLSKFAPYQSVKKDTEKIIHLIEEYKECANIKGFKDLKKQYEREKNLRSSILDHLDDMVWCKDLEGKYLMTNKAFREKFCYGLSDTEILGKNDIELAKIFKAKVGDANHTFGEKCFNSDLVIHEVQEALQFLESGNINGNMLKMVVNKSPIRDYTGNMFGVVGSGRDVTEWHSSLENAIKDANACFGTEGKNLLLKELNKLEFK